MVEELKKPRQTTKSKPGKAAEALIFKTEWDTAAVEIFINIYYQGGQHKRTQRCKESGSTSRRIWYFSKANLRKKEDKRLPIFCTGKTQMKGGERRCHEMSKGDSAKHARVKPKETGNSQ